MQEYFLDEIFQEQWQGCDPFDAAFALEGKDFRCVKARRTLAFSLAGRNYFAKLHRGIGWREIFKDLLQFKKPVLGAYNEYHAIRHLEKIGVPTMTACAYAVRGSNPARQQSFLVTAALENTVSLEEFCANWKNDPPEFRFKTRLLKTLAAEISAMHRSGLNHRDCYLAHFLLHRETMEDTVPRLSVIDLHRAQIRTKVPYRFHVKDVAGIYFSAMEIGLTRNDRFRFLKHYENRPLREILRENGAFWLDVEKTAQKLYRKIQRKGLG